MRIPKLFRTLTIAAAGLSMTVGTTSAAVAAPACQSGGGCLLPLASAPAPAAAPVEAAAPVAAVETAGGGIGILAILGGLAAAALIAVLVFSGDDNDAPDSP